MPYNFVADSFHTGVTAEALRAKIDQKTAISLQCRHFDPKFQVQGVAPHQSFLYGYVEDTQIYGFCRPHEVSMLADRVSECVDEKSAWMMANRLRLNPAKSEILWCASARRLHQIPTGPVRIGNTTVLPEIGRASCRERV